MIALPELLELLNSKYLNKYNAIIIGGFEEPFYKAPVKHKSAEIQFSYDYIRSALHELAHWCVAGVERRKKDDYGYWYASDGRNQQQQNEFFQVEIKPQAIEWAFSIMCGVKFEPSIDNLHNSVIGVDEFKNNVFDQLNYYLDIRFNPRTAELIHVLAKHQNITSPIKFIQNSINH